MHFYWKELKKIRKKNKLSVTYMISKLNVCRKTFWLWENGKRIPKEENIRKLAKIIDIPVSILSDLQDEQPVSNQLFSKYIEKQNENLNSYVDPSSNMFLSLINSINLIQKQHQQDKTVIKALMGSINVMFYIKDANLNYITVNEFFANAFPLQSGLHYKGKNDDFFFSKSEAKSNTKEDKETILLGNPVINREGYLPGSRKKKWAIISKYPILDNESKILGLVGTFIDITERKNIEIRNQLLEKIISDSEECVWIADNNSKVIYVNKAFEKITGIKIEEIKKNPKSWLDIVHPDDLEKVNKLMEKNKYPKKITYRIIRKTDNMMRIIKETYYGENNIFYFGIARDITDYKNNGYLH